MLQVCCFQLHSQMCCGMMFRSVVMGFHLCNPSGWYIGYCLFLKHFHVGVRVILEDKITIKHIFR